MNKSINSLASESTEDLGRNSLVYYNGKHWIITNVNGDIADLMDPMDHGEGIPGIPIKDLTPVTASAKRFTPSAEKGFPGPRNLVFESGTAHLSADEEEKVNKMVHDAKKRCQTSLPSELQ